MHGQPSTSTFHSSPSSSSRFSSWVKRLAELKTCPWYWGDLSWKNAEKLLLLCEDGSFLVRDSHSDNHLFTVSYKYSGKVYHSRVEISGQHIHLGAPFSMERPESIADLLKHAIQVSYGRERDILMYRRGDEADSSEIRLQYPLSLMATIFALSSGALPAAIAVFRISGNRSLPVLREITRKQKWKPREMRYTKILTKKNEILDTAMAVYMPGPSTFTGEDTAELFVHGSRAVADALAERLSDFEGVRQATRGEFTKRAFFNGKMDLHEVYGMRNLINAETQRQRQMSYSQMRGGAEAHRIRDMLSDAVMRAFVLMDFGEHVSTSIDDIHERLYPILKEVLRLESRAKGAEIVHKGLRAVILGRPNTGKSSLMNALAQRDVAIVSERAGTTRDSIEIRLNIAGVPMSLTDTAGIRNAEDSLEREGVERAKRKILEADVVIAVVDASGDDRDTSSILAELEELAVTSLPVIVVRNKSDLARGRKFDEIKSTARLDIVDCIETCALNPEGTRSLQDSLERLVNSLCPDDSGPCMTDTKLLRQAREELENALTVKDTALLCDHLQRALDIFGQMAGSTVSEQILDDLFKQFCIGK
ncbi:hypothetical protein V3C99_006235 [Haemonchus contortus]|uniref:tRNA modification GTPase TrmE n=1 Tax=Haemonchus contortus TaxID=6289 RepID=A0A7I5E545_HAECO